VLSRYILIYIYLSNGLLSLTHFDVLHWRTAVPLVGLSTNRTWAFDSLYVFVSREITIMYVDD
jgi:hypothetical protein